MIRSILSRLALSFAVLVGVLLALEAGVRSLQFLNVLPVFTGQELRLKDFVLTPFTIPLRNSSDPLLVVEFDPASPLLNREGTRGADFSVEKPANTARIVVLGDSVTFGFGVPTEDTFCSRLEKKLNDRPAASHVEVLNYGVNGYGTAEEVRVLETRGLAVSPDAVVVGYVLNDVVPPSVLVSIVTDMTVKSHSIEHLAPSLQIGAWALTRWNSPGVARSPYEYYEGLYADGGAWERVVGAMTKLAAISRERHLPAGVVIFPMLDDYDRYSLGKYYAKVHALLDRLQIPYLDLREVYEQSGMEKLRFAPNDTTHPNALGHEVAAQALEGWLPGVIPALRK